MYCRNHTGTVRRVLCREVYFTVSLFGRVHYMRFHLKWFQPIRTILVYIYVICITNTRVVGICQQCYNGFTYIGNWSPFHGQRVTF